MSLIRNVTEVIKLTRGGDVRLLNRALRRLDNVQIASLLDNLEEEEQDRILQVMPLEQRAEILANMRYEVAAQIISRLAPEEAAHVLDEIESDDAADILGRVEPKKLQEILSRVNRDEVNELVELLAYDETSAGGLMSLEVFRVRKDVTIAEVTRMVQEAEELPSQEFYIYVVDENDRLVGVTTLRQLVVNKPDKPIHAVMETELVFVTPDTDQEDVADLASRYDLVAIPVVDDQRRLLGVVTIDDIVDVIREEATEDILKMAGAGEMLVDTRAFGASFRVRMPWLLIAAIGGLLVAFSLKGFEDTLQKDPVLALFMPVVAGMGGNVGTQSSTIIVRGIAVGYIDTSRMSRLLLREVGLGASLGILYGVLVALLSILMGITSSNPFKLGVVVTIGMVGCMVIAAAVGTSVPLILHRFHVDPAIATGPFVTTSVDILGLLFYFWLATTILGMIS